MKLVLDGDYSITQRENCRVWERPLPIVGCDSVRVVRGSAGTDSGSGGMGRGSAGTGCGFVGIGAVHLTIPCDRGRLPMSGFEMPSVWG